jgi:hypothetical protein
VQNSAAPKYPNGGIGRKPMSCMGFGHGMVLAKPYPLDFATHP